MDEAATSSFILEEFVKNLQISSKDGISNSADVISKALPCISTDMISGTLAKHKQNYHARDGAIPKHLHSSHRDDALHSYILNMLDKDAGGKIPAKTHQSSAIEQKSSFVKTKKAHHGDLLGGNIVIHVCDESKKLSEDFSCPRGLLVREMKYFAEYLSVESQHLEEIDISVHCDIDIFDWLMRYVKRSTSDDDSTALPPPCLEANNVVSILISSDFLRMDALVAECIDFCHANMSQILATPCNMNCINDKLCQRIAAKFSHGRLEDIRDKKDKFKSKLFCKKIEQLFVPAEAAAAAAAAAGGVGSSSSSSSDLSGRASTLFKCKFCHRVLTCAQSSMIPCVSRNMSVSATGEVTYAHESAERAWDCTAFIIALHEQLRKWSLVYWRLWSIVNHLQCTRCRLHFQLFELERCRYHPEKPKFTTTAGSPLGYFPCCQQQLLRFDPANINSRGCQVRNHAVSPDDFDDPASKQLVADLMNYEKLVKLDYEVDGDALGGVAADDNMNIFSAEEISCGISNSDEIAATGSSSVASSSRFSEAAANVNVRRYQHSKSRAAVHSRADVGADEDESSSDDADGGLVARSRNSKVVITKPPVSTQQFSSTSSTPSKSSYQRKPIRRKSTGGVDTGPYRKCPSKRQWDPARTTRYNQDVQREEDRRRMNQLASYVNRQQAAGAAEKLKHTEFHGGVFIKLEHAFLNSVRAGGHVDSTGGGGARHGRTGGQTAVDSGGGRYRGGVGQGVTNATTDARRASQGGGNKDFRHKFRGR